MPDVRYQSKLLIPTLREAPKDAETVSHQLMYRTGMIQKQASGIYSLLPLGLKVVRKFEAIVRKEMDNAGAQEILMPAVIPAELWQESGRWQKYGPELMRVQDRHGRDFVIGPTHEEVVTDIFRKQVNSYKALPVNLYQIQTKFRDEVRPRFGVMRGREFIMKDAYSFHEDNDSLDRTYEAMCEAYTAIFKATGMHFVIVDADSGNIGGSRSQEFMVLADSGEDSIAFCEACGYSANTEKASFRCDPVALEETKPAIVETPNVSSIEEVSSFLDIPAAKLLKTLVYDSNEGAVLVVLAGNRTIEETKLLAATDLEWLHPMETERIESELNAPVGFIGAIDFPGKVHSVLVDRSATQIENGVTGANIVDRHLKNVNIRNLADHTICDVSQVLEGDQCPKCDQNISVLRGIEVGHIFKLGTQYSEKQQATVLDQNGKSVAVTMGCYGIGITRTIAAAIEQNNDEKGILWPWALSPWQVHILALDPDTEAYSNAEKIILSAAAKRGIDVLVDDRKERPGVKFNDADLLGIPIQLVAGKRSLEKGVVEIKNRATGLKTEVELSSFSEELDKLIVAYKN